MKLSGGDLLMRALKDEGVKFIFGYPGGAALHIYDSIFKQKACEHILVRHEQGATHAADGYSRATGKPGVALVTSGPGATNAITGLAAQIDMLESSLSDTIEYELWLVCVAFACVLTMEEGKHTMTARTCGSDCTLPVSISRV